MTETAEIMSPDFSIADAQDVTFNFDGDHLILQFEDWQETRVRIIFEHVIGSRYEFGESQLCEGERFDSIHLIRDSKWLQRLRDQGETWDGPQWAHYKLNFNAEGVLEVLCAGMRKVEDSTS